MGRMTAADPLSRAAGVSEEALFPAALKVDSADRIPVAHFEAIAAAGLYGIAGPAYAGGLDADLATFCGVIEVMSAGCLATTFVWLQHHSAVRALATTQNAALRDQWLESLCQGTRRAGIALGGARPGPPRLRARPVAGGYLLDGSAPWVTGWDMVDVVHTVARDEADNLIAALLPAQVGPTLQASRLDLVAVNASRTVELAFNEHFVPAELVSGVIPIGQWLAMDARSLRPNGSLSLGVAARCIRLLGQTGEPGSPGLLAAELAARRIALDHAAAPRATSGSLPAARAAASAFAFQAAGLLLATAGSQAIRHGAHPQRLAREALFLLVFGTRPAIKEHLVTLLAARSGN